MTITKPVLKVCCFSAFTRLGQGPSLFLVIPTCKSWSSGHQNHFYKSLPESLILVICFNSFRGSLIKPYMFLHSVVSKCMSLTERLDKFIQILIVSKLSILVLVAIYIGGINTSVSFLPQCSVPLLSIFLCAPSHLLCCTVVPDRHISLLL